MNTHFTDVHEALLSFVRDQLKDPVIVLDDDGRIVGANRAAADWGDLGLLTAFGTLVGPAPDPQVVSFWTELRAHGYAEGELTRGDSEGLRRSEPNSRVFELAGVAVTEHYVVHCHEITHARDVERELSTVKRTASSALGSRSIIHDLNDVLAPIPLLCGLLRQESSQRIKTIATQIESSAALAAGLAQRLRVLSSMHERVAGIDVPSMHRTVEELVGDGISVLVEVQDGTLVDPQKLEHTVRELAAGARAAMPDGGRLTIRVTGHGLLVASHFPSPSK